MLLFFYQYTSSSIHQSSSELLSQTGEKIIYKLDTIIESMDTTTLQIVANRDLQDILLESSSYSSDYNYFDYHNESKVKNILTSINSPLLTNARISIFDSHQNYITVGYLSTSEAYSFLNSYKKYENLTSLETPLTQTAIYPPHLDNWTYRNPATVFSFLRKIPYIDGVNQFLAYIEIMQPYSMIENAVAVATDKSITVTILDSNNQVVYPYNALTQEQINYYSDVISSKNDIHIRPWDSQKEYAYHQTSSISNWTIILSQNENDYLSTLYIFRRILIFISSFFYVFMLCVLFTVTAYITSPITKLRKRIEDLSQTNSSLHLEIPESSGEIAMLTNAFNHALYQLTTSMEETLIANKNQVNAHILAMQSQMNPHFLFNTLMGISGIAEEEGNERIVYMCDKLSSMLRYISSFKDASVPLKDEIEYTTNYLELMKIRYEDFLSYELHIDTSVYSIPVAKLILQPIVDNCFSHGFKNVVPPYNIKIDIIQDDGILNISVIDNGSGISPDKLLALNTKIKQCKNYTNICDYVNNSELGGLGITNIYLRLQLKYGQNVQISISNNETSGCHVQIQLPLNSDKGVIRNDI